MASMDGPKVFPQNRKRPLELNIQDTPYYKMRALLRDLRPHFIEVLKTPDFRNCKAAVEICEGMKLMVELKREMTAADTAKLQKCSNVPGHPSDDVHDGQKKPLDQPAVKAAVGSPKDEADELTTTGTYIVGGSAFGWNFVTYHGTQAVYYGQTKEAYRAANPKSS